MERLRKIIKEELKKALSEIVQPFGITQYEDEIIYNFERGRTFGINNLAQDINGLDEYYMNDYFPRSEVQESWMFEIENYYGGSQLIEITHQDKSGSQWKLDISEVEKGSDVPTINNSTGWINGYNNFINVVNSKLEKEINPNLL